MVPDVAAARELVELRPDEEMLLRSRERPIVLAPRRERAPVAAAVAPAARELGVMLPYTPLHHLLLADVGVPLVMTSGNVSDEPIAFEDGEAIARLEHIADVFLLHDRPIHMRTDDSVVRVAAGRPLMVRRSRGHVPAEHPAARAGRAAAARVRRRAQEHVLPRRRAARVGLAPHRRPPEPRDAAVVRARHRALRAAVRRRSPR